MPDRPGAAASIFIALADANCNVDTIIQNEPRDRRPATPRCRSRSATEDLRAAEQALAPVQAELGIDAIDTDREIGKVSIVGAGMRSHPGVAAKVFQTLAEEGINIEMISTSPIKISCIIRADVRPAGGPRAARRLRARRGRDRAPRQGPAMTRVPWSAPPAPSAASMLELLRERGFPADEIVLFASAALGRPP